MDILSEKSGALSANYTSHVDNVPARYPRTRLQKWATSLLKLHYIAPEDRSEVFAPLAVVCISDTCSGRPEVPAGDLLVHAGNLTQTNSRDDLQEQIAWIDSLPHKHKVIIAGDRDAWLLDQAWKNRDLNQLNYDARRDAQTVAHASLYFGDVVYLNDSGVTLNFANNRQASIFGSPSPCKDRQLERRSGRRSARAWRGFVPKDIDLLLTNETLYYQVDVSARHANLRLFKQLVRSRPKMVVSRGSATGSQHVAEDTVFDGVRGEYEGIMAGVEGCDGLYRMWVRVLVKRTGYGLRKMLCLKPQRDQRTKIVGGTTDYNDGRAVNLQAVTVNI